MKKFYLLFTLFFLSINVNAQQKILFDASKAETAANADWVIDEDSYNLRYYTDGTVSTGGSEGNAQRYPTPSQSGITSGTPETYWSGGLSYYGVSMVKQGYWVETLPWNGRITYGDGTNLQDLSNYDVYVMCEPNIMLTAVERTAILTFVYNGGGLYMLADHGGTTPADRNNDGNSSLDVFNYLMAVNHLGVPGNPFGMHFDDVDISQNTTNIPNLPGDPLLHGIGGDVAEHEIHGSTTITLDKVANPSCLGVVYKTGSSNTGSINCLCAYSTYGSGRIVGMGDSSPAEDNTGDPGDVIYDGWIQPTSGGNQGDNGQLITNATIWLAGTSTPLPEPDNQPTALSATAISSSQINLIWTGATGTNLPTAYLILYNTTGTFTDPVDGVAQPDGTGIKNVNFGTNNVSITGLNASTLYYFKIWSYSNTGININYKINGTPPTANATTLAASASCATDLIISEYLEGSSNNKYIEIYNKTGVSVDLSNYKLQLFANGAVTPTQDITLSGTLTDGSTIVYKNSAATIYAGAATVSAAVAFNGNDAVALYKISTSSFVDIFGNIGCNPGTAWTNTNTTLDKTLVRNASVTTGITTDDATTCPFNTLASEWTQYNIDVATYLGSHTMTCASPCATPTTQASDITFSSVTQTGMTINWTNGNGTKRIVFVKQTNSGNASPVDNTTYIANTIFPTGSQIGTSGWYCVYNSTGTSIAITGLTANTDYQVMVCEYDCATGSEKYLTTTVATNPLNQTTLTNPDILLSDNGTQIAAATVPVNTTNLILHQFKLEVTSANATLSGMTCTTAGTYLSADITNLKVRYSTDNILDGADVTLSTFTTPGTAGAKIFPSFTSQIIYGDNTGYIFITADVSSTASGARTINCNAISNTNLTFVLGNKSGSTTIGGTQTFYDAEVALAVNGAVPPANVEQGQTNVILSSWSLASSAGNTVLNTASMTVNGTYITTDIAANGFKLWSNTTNSFGSASQIGSSISAPGGGTQFINFNGLTQAVNSGTPVYFWFTVNISSGGTIGNNIQRTISTSADFTYSNNVHKTGSYAAGGLQTIITANPTVVLADNGTQISTANVLTGTSNHILHKFQLTVTVADATLSGLQCITTGTYISSDITNLIVRYSTDATLDIGDVILSSFSNPGFAGTKTFPSFTSQLINSGSTGYVFITCDIASGATSGNTISVNAVTTSHTTFSETVTESGSTTSGETQTIIKPEPMNNATSFVCGTSTSNSIQFTWTDASGGTTPDKYLILCNTTGTFTNPTNGVAQSDVVGSIFNVNQGVQTATFSSLTQGTTYFFKIFPYSNTGTNINYKIDGTVLTGSCSTLSGPCISEGFNNYDTGTRPSGWTFTNIPNSGTYTTAGNYGTSSPSLKMDATGDIIETSTISNASELKFWFKGQGTGASDALLVEGWNGSWSTIQNITNSIPTVVTTKIYNSSTTPALAAGFTKFRFTYTKVAGNLAFDDVEITCGSSCTGPTAQASVFSSNSITGTSMNIAFTRGNGDAGVLVIARAGSAVNADPTSGTSYTANSVFGTGQQIGTGNYVVYNGVANGVSIASGNIPITGLSANTTYYFAIYEYNSTGTCYNLTELTGNATTLCVEPTTQATTLTFPSINSTSLGLSWTSGNGSSRIVVAHESALVDETPVDFTTYSANSVFGLGNEIGTGNFVIYNGSGNTVTVTGLTTGTTYNFTIFEYSCSAGGEDYLLTGLEAEGFETTLPSNVSNFKVVCTTTSTTELSWVLPTGNYDGILIIADQGETPATPSCDGGDLINPVTNYSTADVYCTNANGSIYVFNNIGTTVSISGLTGGLSYTYKAYVYKEGAWSSGVNVTAAADIDNPVDFAATCRNSETELIWTNPNSACFDEIIIVAHTASISGLPLGSYTANSLDFTNVLNPNFPGGGKVVYNGTITNQTVTNLTNGTTYYFKIFTRSGTDWSVGVEINCMPSTAVILGYGDLAIVGVNTSLTDGSNDGPDEIQFISFVDITTNTSIDFTDNGFERENLGLWGEGEGVVRFTRTGTDVPAGTVVLIRGRNAPYTLDGILWDIRTDANFDGDFDDPGDSDISNWSLSSLSANDPFDLNIDDQIWMMQGGNWIAGAGSHDADYTGKVLYGWTATGWKSNIGNTPTTWTTKGSRLVPGSECSNSDVSGVANHSKVKYNGDDFIIPNGLVADAAQRTWISRFNDETLWSGYIDNATYYSGGTLPDCPIPNKIGINGIGFTYEAQWTGEKNTNWFDCTNWLNLKIPDATSNIIFITDNCANDIVINSSETPVCNDFTTGGTIANHAVKLEGDVTKILTINGNLTIGASNSFDFDDGTATTDGVLRLYGNWNNTAGITGFLEGNSSVEFLGNFQQDISSIADESFYNITINNNSANGIIFSSGNIITSGELALSNGVVDLNGNNLTVSGIYSRTNGVFKGNSGSDLLISGSGTLADFIFAIPQELDNFEINRSSETAVLSSNLNVNTNLTATSGTIQLNAGKFFTVFGILSSPAAASLVLKSNATGTASLIHSTENVPATSERYLESNKWNFIYPPLSDIPKSIFTFTSSGAANPNFYWYNENIQDYWSNLLYSPMGWSNETNPNLQQRGYIHYSTESNTYIMQGGTLEYNSSLGYKQFDVVYTLHSGTCPAPVSKTYSDNFDGWNYIGNPFSSAFDWNSVVRSNVDNGIYYFDGTNYVFFGGATMQNQGLTINGNIAGNEIVPANQGFFIKASANGYIRIPNNSRTHSGKELWKSSSTDYSNILRFEIINADFSDETVIRSLNEASDSYEGEVDGLKMFSWDNSKPQLFSHNGTFGNYFILNSISLITDNYQVPLGVIINKTEEHIISFTENTYENVNIYLEDKYLNTLTNIRANPNYSFSSELGTFTDRFVIHFELNNAPIAEEVSDIEIYEDNYFEIDLNNVFNDSDLLDELTIEIQQSDNSILPMWISKSNLVLSGIPSNEDVGSYTIKMTATDLTGAFTETQFKIIVLNVNDAPFVNIAPENQTVFEDVNFELILDAYTFTDIDFTDNLLYSSSLADYGLLPEWLNFECNTLTYSGLPENKDVGTYEISLSATDTEGTPSVTYFTIEVLNVNDPPQLNNTIPDFYAQVGTELSIELNDNTFTDIDITDLLSYSSIFPSWLNFDPFSLSFVGTPSDEGINEISVTATDLSGAFCTGIFYITVLPSTTIVVEGNYKISVYPNPSEGKFVIVNESAKTFDICITDISGKKVRQIENITSQKTEIDLSNLAKGFYNIEIYVEENIYYEKIILH